MNPFVINKTPLTATMGVKPNDVSLIQLRPALGGADAPRLPCGGVRRALLLRLLEGALLAQESLAFVSLARSTPFQDQFSGNWTRPIRLRRLGHGRRVRAGAACLAGAHGVDGPHLVVAEREVVDVAVLGHARRF